MYYILCEGSVNGSEYKFILNVICEFRVDELYSLTSAHDKENIFSAFLDLYKKFSVGDTFILIFDNIEVINGIQVFNFLEKIENMCSSKGVYFRYTEYYSFEELFLTYDKLVDLSNLQDSVKIEIKKVQNMILSGINYFKEDLSFWRQYYKNRDGVFRTREELSSAICNTLTTSIKGKSFSVKKSNIGTCLVKDCRDTTLHENVCKNCSYKMKSSSFRAKLKDLDENSISKFSLPFSTIFD